MEANPTHEAYSELQEAYDAFNRALFDGSLPSCLLTLQREKATYGYFSSQRFSDRKGRLVDEIAMNPSFFGVVPLVETMQTLAHEMCHLWQAHHGTPGRRRYHNEEWAAKMESIGLMPSSTGQPGGKRTGEHMADYPVPGGRFLAVCEELLTRKFTVSWYDRFPPARPPAPGHYSAVHASMNADLAASALMVSIEVKPTSETMVDGGGEDDAPQPAAVELVNKSNRLKYTCGCKKNVWGKPGLRIQCMECGKEFSCM